MLGVGTAVWICVCARKHMDSTVWFVAWGEDGEGAVYQVIRYKNKPKRTKYQSSLRHRIIMKIS